MSFPKIFNFIFLTSKLHVKKFTKMCQGLSKIALKLSLTCDVITMSLWSHVSHFVQSYHFGKKDFELGVGGEGQDTSRFLI